MFLLLRNKFFIAIILLQCIFGTVTNAGNTDFIFHHIADENFGPAILISNNGVEVFRFSNFYDQNSNKVPYKGYELDSYGQIKNIDTNRKLFLNLSITKNVVWMFLAVLLILSLLGYCYLWYRRNSYNTKPNFIVSFFEIIYDFLVNGIFRPNIGEKQYKRFSPFLIIMFFYIWVSNTLGLLPGAANVTGSISVASCLAFLVFIATNMNAKKKYLKDIFFPHVPAFLYPVMIPIEILEIFTRPFTLMLRLFLNMTSGHILILSVIGLIFTSHSIFVGCLAAIFNTLILILKIAVSFLQAYIFVLLSSIYIGSAVEEEHSDSNQQISS